MDTGSNYPLHGHWTFPQDVSHVDIFSLFDCLLNDTVNSPTTATIMAFTATTILQFVTLVTWTCLSDTPFNQKNTLFARFLTSLSVLEVIASTASLNFAPGLLDVLQAAAPPTIEFFKRLPTDTLPRWGVYVIVLEKPGCRPRLYIGSGTNTIGGVRVRLRQYDDGFLLPQWVKDALDHGYTIVHKGLLCWISEPIAALGPVSRLLLVAVEAAFAYMFWAMKARTSDYGMGHICLWNRHTLEYDGLCSHPSLNEGISGDFDLSAEQIEAQAIEKEQKRLAMKAENATNHHYKQMEENYDEYIGQAGLRVAKSRAKNPGRDRKHQADRVEKALTNKSYRCELCDISFGTKQILQKHEKCPKHARKEHEADNPFRCGPCNLGFNNQSNLSRHEKSDRHQKKVAAARPGRELD